MNSKQHIDSLDILKGYAIFMVVWGHLIDNENILFRYLNNLHLPLFFIISGYLLAGSLSRHTCEYVLKRKFFHLFIPFLSWSTVALVLKTGIIIKNNSFSIKLFYMIFSDVFINVNSVWFLWILFLGSCLLIFYEKIQGKKIFFWLLILCMYIFLPNNVMKLGKLKIMFPILFFGFWLYKKSGNRWLKINVSKRYEILFSIFILSILYFFYDKELYIAFTEFRIPILSKEALWYLYYWTIQFSGILFSVYILLPFFKKFKLEKFFKIAGIYSLDIYMQHLFFVNYIITIPTYNTFIKQIVIIIYAIFITLFCVVISKYVLHKIKLYRILMIGQDKITN